jgi:hypothetical protein
VRKEEYRMKLEEWVNNFLESGGTITLCKPKDKPKRRCGGAHCLFAKCKKQKFKPVIVLKRRNLK